MKHYFFPVINNLVTQASYAKPEGTAEAHAVDYLLIQLDNAMGMN